MAESFRGRYQADTSGEVAYRVKEVGGVFRLSTTDDNPMPLETDYPTVQAAADAALTALTLARESWVAQQEKAVA